ncbi:MAG TPA: acyltransferase [Acidimicrobiales bacterium]|nr:acyltransferase [Acidimicrobiales bacterium]
MRRAPARAAFRLAHLAGSGAGTLRRRLRRRLLLAQVALRAAWGQARVDCALAPDVRLGRRVRVTVAPRTTAALHVGARSAVGDDVRIDLRGGSLVVGPDVDIRHGCVLGVSGRLELTGPALVQHGVTLHCDEAVTVGPYAGIAEYVTVIDSSHVLDGPSDWFLDDLRTAPVTIGARAWVGAKATVARGVRVGEGAVVGANSMVVKDVPAGQLASGVPAGVVRPVGGRAVQAAPAPERAGQRRAGTRAPVDAVSSSS